MDPAGGITRQSGRTARARNPVVCHPATALEAVENAGCPVQFIDIFQCRSALPQLAAGREIRISAFIERRRSGCYSKSPLPNSPFQRRRRGTTAGTNRLADAGAFLLTRAPADAAAAATAWAWRMSSPRAITCRSAHGRIIRPFAPSAREARGVQDALGLRERQQHGTSPTCTRWWCGGAGQRRGHGDPDDVAVCRPTTGVSVQKVTPGGSSIQRGGDRAWRAQRLGVQRAGVAFKVGVLRQVDASRSG